jgi:hypothetical protein
MKTTLLTLCLSASAFAAPAPTYDLVPRLEFNTRAIEHHLPLFWRTDANDNKAIDPDELAVLWTDVATKRGDWVDAKGAFTKKFTAAYGTLTKPTDCSTRKGEEVKRCESVVLELSQGRPTLVENDFSAGDQALVEHMQKAAVLTEKIFARQNGVDSYFAKLPKGDDLSHALFFRNQSPFCAAPKTENEPMCSALPVKPKQLSGLYPADVQADKAFCAALEKQPNGKDLMGHFSAVIKGKAKETFEAIPYPTAYKAEMEAIAKELDAAAAGLDATEAALKTYLTAAAKSFRTNDWEPSNEAWVAMGIDNSKYYLRVAPDEVYYEPCAWKAGFALQFARINKDSLTWQKKLEPVKGDMEKALATLAGPPYAARDVKFKLPDFIEVVLNAGDQRNPHGATIGQSLPNWGPVSEKGGRTVAMVNLYTDADSLQSLKDQMSSLFCEATFAKASLDAKGNLMSTLLHEAAHNLGPAHDYKVNGKADDELLGGPMAATMEELKAQTSAMFFADWLAEKKVISDDDADKAHVRDIAWGFGHISRGMYSADGKPKNYSQLASIQQGFLRKAGALTWKADGKAANGKDVGCIELDLKKFKTATADLEKQVLMVKAKGDKAAAEKLKADFVDAKDEWEKVRASIAERWLRAPKASFVYSVKI